MNKNTNERKPIDAQLIREAMVPDYIKIIRYLEYKEKQNKRYNNTVFLITLFGAVGSVIAAITGIVLLFQ